jgi:hypothetical protein
MTIKMVFVPLRLDTFGMKEAGLNISFEAQQ